MFTQQVMCGCNVQYYPQSIREFGDNQRPLLLTFYNITVKSCSFFVIFFFFFCCHVFVTMHRYKTSMHLYYTRNMHTSTDITTQMQTHAYKCCHSHTYRRTYNNKYKYPIPRENVHELLQFSVTPSFSLYTTFEVSLDVFPSTRRALMYHFLFQCIRLFLYRKRIVMFISLPLLILLIS